MQWTNWSGSVKCNPTSIEQPHTEEEIQQLVQKAASEGRKIRMVGSGHSFSRLAQNDDILLSLDNYQGLINNNKDELWARVKAGTKIKALGELLHGLGMAQENLGDIDVQSIAGAISTGTHGTGTAFGNLSTQLTAIRFVNGKGEIVECSTSEQPDLFKAAQLSLGSLGVITELTLKLVPSYRLEFTSGREDLDSAIQNFDKRNQENRNFEFYWFPYTKTVQTKFCNQTDKPAQKYPWVSYMSDLVLENYVFWLLNATTRAIPSLSKSVAKLSAWGVSTSTKVNHSHKVYSLPRLVRFNEMEYCVPIECFRDVMKDVVAAVHKHKFHVNFPSENRFVKADNIYLSPAYQRNAAYIAVHVFKGKEYRKYFDVMEEIFMAYEGRPHWGKMHTRKADYLSQVYPMWDTFQSIRKEQDPEGVFETPYTKELLS